MLPARTGYVNCCRLIGREHELKKQYRILIHALPAVQVVVLWQMLSLILSSPAFPGPLEVLPEFCSGWSVLLTHASASIGRVFGAILTSTFLALPLGLVIGGCEPAYNLLSPLIYSLYPIPKVAFLPVIMLLLGLGDAPKIVLMDLIIFFQILVAVVDARRGIDRQLVAAIMTLGPTRFQLLWHVLLPATLPRVITAVRISIGTAMSVLFFAETFGTNYGLGFFITDAWMRMDYLAMFSGIVTQSLLGLLLFRAISWLESKLCQWQGKQD